MATMYSTTRPLMLCAGCGTDRAELRKNALRDHGVLGLNCVVVLLQDVRHFKGK